MEHFVTFRSTELDVVVHSVYREICNNARDSALMFVSTRENNNPFHFDQVVAHSNKAITNLLGLYAEYDKRKDEYPFLVKETLIKQAEDFFAVEIY